MRKPVLAALLGLACLLPSHAADEVKAPAPAPPSAAPPCKMYVRAILDMDMDDTGRITAPILLNGIEKRMMIDTGASDTLIAVEAVNSLHLKEETAADGRYIMGYGGSVEDKVVKIAEFGIAQMKGKDFPLFVMHEDFDSAGLLGADILRSFDLDFDFAVAKLRLMAPNECRKVYWSNEYGVVPFEIDGNHIKVQMKLDGVDVTAILDTGAADTVMSLEKAAGSFDLDADKLRKSRHYPFKVLSFGQVTVANPAIELVPDKESGLLGHSRYDQHMILGMGVLRRLHLYIDYKHKQVYVTPATQY